MPSHCMPPVQGRCLQVLAGTSMFQSCTTALLLKAYKNMKGACSTCTYFGGPAHVAVTLKTASSIELRGELKQEPKRMQRLGDTSSARLLEGNQRATLGFAACRPLAFIEQLPSQAIAEWHTGTRPYTTTRVGTKGILKTCMPKRPPSQSLPHTPSRMMVMRAQAIASSLQSVMMESTSESDHEKIEVTVPLSERPAGHGENLAAVHHYYEWARERAAAVGDRFLEEDNGPSSSELAVCLPQAII